MRVMKQQIQLVSDEIQSNELYSLLLEELHVANEELRFELRFNPWVTRSPINDPTVLVAIVAGVSASISTLINGIFRILENRQQKNGRILLVGKDGRSVEVPAGTPKEEIQALIELTKNLDLAKIEIITIQGSSDITKK
jgi:hypothetical protein